MSTTQMTIPADPTASPSPRSTATGWVPYETLLTETDE